eukprot:CAMPEP_0115064040 /NCGR_PEP_ID=MMETSP0227-20121206/9446_1 /TAXON_ID=89957 /ORGANISM="Polarella glacialis, Strain CCMP 1383" /LENGTH=41 /DNA_ID= /DNA_START= /DNA_END= /DNA_ORIENTATION=
MARDMPTRLCCGMIPVVILTRADIPGDWADAVAAAHSTALT